VTSPPNGVINWLLIALLLVALIAAVVIVYV